MLLRYGIENKLNVRPMMAIIYFIEAFNVIMIFRIFIRNDKWAENVKF